MSTISSDLSRVVQYLENPGPYRAPIKVPKKHHLYDVLATPGLCLEVYKYLRPLEDLAKMAPTSKLFRDAVPLAREHFLIEFNTKEYEKLLPIIFRSVALPELDDAQKASYKRFQILSEIKMPLNSRQLYIWLDLIGRLSSNQISIYQEALKKHFPKAKKINRDLNANPDEIFSILRLFQKTSISVIKIDHPLKFGDMTIQSISKLYPEITELHLGFQFTVTKAILLAHLPQFKNLHSFTLWNQAEFDDEVLIALANKGDLRKVSVLHSKITDRGISELVQRNPGLTHLEVSENNEGGPTLVTELGLKAIGDHAKALLSLKLSFHKNTNLSVQALKELLAKLPNLREFVHFSSKHFDMDVWLFSEKEKEALQEQYPKITFYYNCYNAYRAGNGI